MEDAIKNIYNVSNIWKDLDSAYDNRDVIHKNLSKKEYLYLVTGYIEEERRTRLDYVKSRLTEEMGNYNNEELSMYTVLLEIFAGVDSLLKSSEIEEIDSLNKFVLSARNTAASVKTISNKLSDNFFTNLQPVKIVSNADLDYHYDFTETFNTCEGLGDTFVLDHKTGKVKSYNVSNSQKDFYILNCNIGTIKLYEELNSETSDFMIGVLELGVAIFEDTKVKGHVLFLSDKYFNIDGNIAKVSLGDKEYEVKITAKNIKEEKHSKGYYIPLDTKFGKIKVMLVETFMNV